MQETNAGQNILLYQRQRAHLDGIAEVESFTSSEIVALSSLGRILVEGEDLHIDSFRTGNIPCGKQQQYGEYAAENLPEKHALTHAAKLNTRVATVLRTNKTAMIRQMIRTPLFITYIPFRAITALIS